MSTNKNYTKLNSIGNYTKGAVQNFENNIILEKDYLEKVNKNLEKNKDVTK